jgi:Flp pilus assembly protein TadD
LRELKDYHGALTLLNDAIVAMPDAHELRLDRSLVADAMGDDRLSEADLRFYLDKRPDDASALNALGYTLANRAVSLDEAEKLIGRAMASDPENPAYIDSLGWLRYRQGRLVEARDLLAQAHARFPDPEVSAHYAEVLWQNGERAKARSVLQTALKLTPDDAGLLALKKKLGP